MLVGNNDQGSDEAGPPPPGGTTRMGDCGPASRDDPISMAAGANASNSTASGSSSAVGSCGSYEMQLPQRARI